jgi:hypothetical protein
MPDRRSILIAALEASAAALVAANVFAPQIAARSSLFAQPRPAEKVVLASAVVAERPGPIVGSPSGQTRGTTIQTTFDIKYRTPIDVNDTADIAVTVAQQSVVQSQTPYGVRAAGANIVSDADPSPGTHPLAQLQWPITLRLDGSGFDWTEHEIAIRGGTPLPITEHWIPRAKEAGEYQLRLPLQDINRAVSAQVTDVPKQDVVKVSINGSARAAGGSDDITLPISVWTHLMPARWFTIVTAIGAFLSFLFGTGFLGRAILQRMGGRNHDDDNDPQGGEN